MAPNKMRRTKRRAERQAARKLALLAVGLKMWSFAKLVSMMTKNKVMLLIRRTLKILG